MSGEIIRCGIYASFDGEIVHRYRCHNKSLYKLEDTSVEKETLSMLEMNMESLEIFCEHLEDMASLDNNEEFGTVAPDQVENVVNTALEFAYDFMEIDEAVGELLYADIWNATHVEDDGTVFYYIDVMRNVLKGMQEPLVFRDILYRLLYSASEYNEPEKWFTECVLKETQLFQRNYTSEIVNYDLIDGTPKLSHFYYFTCYADYYTFMLLTFAQQFKRVCFCKCCGNFFVPKTKRLTLYCDRVFTVDGKTCKEIAPKLMQKLRKNHDTLLEEYDRVRNKYYKRYERGLWKLDGEQTEKDLDEKEYKSWASEARAARSAYIYGEMTDDEFKEVIHRLD